MTAPYPADAVGRTPNFQLPFLAVGAPARYTRAVLEVIARELDAALTRGPAAPPAAQDLAAVAGRVSVLEDPQVVRPVIATQFAQYGGPWRPYEFWKVGDTAFLAGTIKPTAPLAVNSETSMSGLPAAYRPTGTDVMGFATIDGAKLCRVDINRDGSVELVNTTGAQINTGALIVLNSFWSVQAW